MRPGGRQLAALAVVLVIGLVLAWQQREAAPPSAPPRSPAPTTPATTTPTTTPTTPTPTPGPAPITPTAPAPTTATVPAEAMATLRLIHRGGPYPYRQDGGVFANRERRLPARPRGHYREFTVDTPGSRDRGARRIVTGGDPPTEFFYTDDHYRSFRRIDADAAAAGRGRR